MYRRLPNRLPTRLLNICISSLCKLQKVDKAEAVIIDGGFGSYLLGLNKKTCELARVNTEGNSPSSYKELKVGWMTAYLFIVCFVGLFVLIPLRKVYAEGAARPIGGTTTIAMLEGPDGSCI